MSWSAVLRLHHTSQSTVTVLALLFEESAKRPFFFFSASLICPATDYLLRVRPSLCSRPSAVQIQRQLPCTKGISHKATPAQRTVGRCTARQLPMDPDPALDLPPQRAGCRGRCANAGRGRPRRVISLCVGMVGRRAGAWELHASNPMPVSRV